MLSAARSVLFAMLVTAGLVTLVVYTRRGETPDVTVTPDPARATVSAADQKHMPVGSAGCLAAACHGAPAEKALRRQYDKDTWQSSGACWTAADPHAAAYFVLTTTDADTKNGLVKVSAEHIMARYAPGKSATDDARCVACHTNPALASEANWKDKVALRNEGVSCEACHGAAGGWQGQHYTAAFKADRKKGYTEHGMEPLYDMGARAVACAGCHVGAPADPASGVPVRDMNHDMIAAGHPRLNFDFADYQARLPRHWQEKKRLEPGAPPYEPNPAKVWLVGRAAHAEAACRLLEDRVNRATEEEKKHEELRAKGEKPRSPWPEYAEFNCAACHHSLRAPTSQKETDAEKDAHSDWRQNLKHTAGRKPGVAPWQPIWPLTSAAGLAWPARMHQTDVEEWERTNALVPFAKRKHDESVARLAKVVWTIEDKWATLDVKPVAAKAAGEMAALRAEWLALPDQVVQDRARKFVAEAGAPIRDWETGAPKVREWDAAAQLFYGAAALERVKPVSANVANFRKVRDALRPQEDAREGPLRAFPLLNWNELQVGFKGILPK